MRPSPAARTRCVSRRPSGTWMRTRLSTWTGAKVRSPAPSRAASSSLLRGGEAIRAGERPRRHRPLSLGERRPCRPRRGRGHRRRRVRPRGRVRKAAEREEDALQEAHPRPQTAPERIENLPKPQATRWRLSMCCFRTGISGYLVVSRNQLREDGGSEWRARREGRQSRC